jgi:hypothetical protein
MFRKKDAACKTFFSNHANQGQKTATINSVYAKRAFEAVPKKRSAN